MADNFTQYPNEVAQRIIAEIQNRAPYMDTKVGQPLRRVFIDPFSYIISDLYFQDYVTQLKYAMETVTGTDLDNFAKNFGFARKMGLFSTGMVTCGRTTPDISNEYTIPAGTIFSNSQGYANEYIAQFMSTESYTLTKGALSVDIPVMSITMGSTNNILAGRVTVMSPVPAGITWCRNNTAMSGGGDKETDDEFKVRLSTTLFKSIVGTEDFYENICLDNMAVSDVNVIEACETYEEEVQLIGTTAAILRFPNILFDTDTVEFDPDILSARDTDYMLTTSTGLITRGSLAYPNESNIPVGTNFKSGTTSTSSTDKTAIGGSWPGNSLSADRVLTSSISLCSPLGIAAGSTIAADSVIESGTTATCPADVSALGGIWTGSGPFTLTAQREVQNEVITVGLVTPIQDSVLQIAPTVTVRYQYTPVFSRGPGTVDIYVKGNVGTSATEEQIFRTGIDTYYLAKSPTTDLPNTITVHSIDPSTRGQITATLYQGTDYVLSTESVSTCINMKNSIKSRSKIVFTTGLGTTHAGKRFRVADYTYDSLVWSLQYAIDANKAVTTDALVHYGDQALIDVFADIMLTKDADETIVWAAIETALSKLYNDMGFTEIIQFSDAIEAIHSIDGVDNAKITKMQLNDADKTTDFLLDATQYPVLNSVSLTRKSRNTWS